MKNTEQTITLIRQEIILKLKRKKQMKRLIKVFIVLPIVIVNLILVVLLTVR